MNRKMFDRIEMLRKWLKERVTCYPTPKKVTLSEFEIDWGELSGSFRVDFDRVQVRKRFGFFVQYTDRPLLSIPLVHCPCGLPYSCSEIEITSETKTAILEGLHHTMPPIRPWGIDPETGKEIHRDTPFSERIIDLIQFEAAKQQVNSGYSISVDIEPAALTTSGSCFLPHLR
jgi:hypothetical protein